MSEVASMTPPVYVAGHITRARSTKAEMGARYERQVLRAFARERGGAA